jgi:phospholipase C
VSLKLTRREAIAAGMAAGVGVYGEGLRRALALPARCEGRLSDIEHVLFLVQENRSFDHYFGTLRGVRGFSDPNVIKLNDGSGRPVFAQPGYTAVGYGGHLYPFHLDVSRSGDCTHDITHEWGAQHRSWNGGRMDGFVREHLADEGQHGPLTVGYYTRADLPYYYALADAFTICDAYHCSVMGPSDPNHVHVFSGMLDPDGKRGGPLITNRSRNGQVTWTTMPEQLRERGITWKVYSGDTSNSPITTTSPAPIFAQYFSDPQLRANGLMQKFPDDFRRDVNAGTLPQVAWIYAPLLDTEHPPLSVLAGQNTVDNLLRVLAENSAIWSKTVLFITWDENGGFFDHVPPLTPPPGTPGEYVTVRPLPSNAKGIAGPIGLGFRVPLLIVSPFTRGGFVCSDTFDHTSLPRFLETRFGAEVPNLSAWRRSMTGDLTSAFNFGSAPVPGFPELPATSPPVESLYCFRQLVTKLGLPGPAYPVPPNSMPTQERGTRRQPSGCPVPKLKLSISPHAVHVGERVRLRFRVTSSGPAAEPVRGAVISIAGRRARTDASGRAVIVLRFRRTGREKVSVTASGYLRTAGSIVVRSAKKQR